MIEYSLVTTSGLKAYRMAVYINALLALLSLFFMPNIGNGILLSTVVYFLYLLALNHGIAKALQVGSKSSIVMVLFGNIFLLGGLIALGVFLDVLFSLVGVLFGFMLCKILYVIGVARP